MEVKHEDSNGYAIDMQVVTVEPAGLTDDHTDKIRVLLDFGEHARELVSSETGLALLRVLANQAEIAHVTGKYAERILAILPHVVFKARAFEGTSLSAFVCNIHGSILPMENTGGRRT
eukprot:scaffold604684_cov46-Prasinocladus_malaysianus.AAC.1